ncbi:MAG: hypothetical protein ACRDA4_02435 [Filifactoraceae bacterium]
MEREGIIVCVGKLNFIGTISIAILCLGLAFLFDLYFIHTSSYVNHAVALILCGVISPSIQGIYFFKKRKIKLIFINVLFIVVALLVLCLGEYLAINFFQLEFISYLYYPGMMLNTILVIVESMYVIVVFVLQRKNIV